MSLVKAKQLFDEGKHAESVAEILSAPADDRYTHNFLLGECYSKMGNWPKAIERYLEAFNADPSRAEPLYRIGNYYTWNSKNNLGFLFARLASDIPKPNLPDVDHAIYNYLIAEDISVNAFYVGKPKHGLAACSQLIHRRTTSEMNRKQAYGNLIYYYAKLPTDREIQIDFLRPLIGVSQERFRPMNSSICYFNNRYYVFCRTVNYDQANSVYTIYHPKGMIITRNFLLTYDTNFNLLESREIVEQLDRTRHTASWTGLEDSRLFRWKDQWWISCTTTDTNKESNPQMSLAQFNAETGQVEQLIPLHGKDLQRAEKNWMPFVIDDKIKSEANSFTGDSSAASQQNLKFIYKHDALLIKSVDLKSGEVETTQTVEQKGFYREFRGSAPPFAFEYDTRQGYLSIVHSVIVTDKRYYTHQFVWMTQDFVIEYVSKPFYFHLKGIEFCGGACLDDKEENVLITVGINDHEAKLYVISVDKVYRLLEG